MVSLPPDTSRLHQCVMDRLTRRAYDVPIMGNIERGGYVEVLVELALKDRDPAWALTETWTQWDIEHPNKSRVEVKQSAALPPWTIENERRKTAARRQFRDRRFNIKPHQRYWSDKGKWVETALQRMADVYVFGWHAELCRAAADQRRAESWLFYVVAEGNLPKLTKSITLGRVQRLAEPCCHADLATRVQAALDEQAELKVNTVTPV